MGVLSELEQNYKWREAACLMRDMSMTVQSLPYPMFQRVYESLTPRLLEIKGP